MQSLIKLGSDSISAQAHFPDEDVRKYLHNEFNEFYESRDYNVAWLDFHQPRHQADELLEALDAAPEHGLSQKTYSIAEIEELLNNLYEIDSKKERRKKWRKLIKSKKYKEELQEADTLRFKKIAQLDFLLTASYLTYASHLLAGRIDPNEEKHWFASRREKDLSVHLEEALNKNEIKASLEALAPAHDQYKALQEYLVHLINTEKKEVPQVEQNLKPGDKGEGVKHAKVRLSFWKNLDPDMKDSTSYNDQMQKAMNDFQEMNGLTATGLIDKVTRELLNHPRSYWIEKIETNMERLRWFQGEGFGDQYILINIPAYELKVINKGDVEMKMKVIIGTEYNRTPVFSDTLEYIDFNPTWTVPKSIAVKEMLPAMREAPNEYLNKRNLKLYDSWHANAKPLDEKEIKKIDWDEVDSTNWKYRLVEDPGPANALGRIKFMMPNNEAIYLHDTPTGHLFDRADRTFSHGCIRLEKPIDLALYLLDWDKEKVLKRIKEEKTSTAVLRHQMPVHIVYLSCWVDENGRINFRKDVYSYDQEHLKRILQKEKSVIS
ncbi:L,D-transpeptidase family protein [Fulvivirga imtechensis]|nr:L,D-transpeptidase family protein [Fulvivirga imtechensis]